MSAGPFIRCALLSDLDQIFALEQQAPAVAHWPRAMYETLLSGYKSAEPLRTMFVAGIANEIVAFCVVSFLKAAQDAEFENITVASPARRAGVGRRLLHQACSWAREQGAQEIHAEVRESSTAARALYCSAGFQQTGRRGGYYQNPAENAIILSLRLRTRI